MLLVTIAFSHYNEKARWGLDHFGVEHRERRYMPMFHFFGVMRATGGRGGRADRASTRWSTPLLVTDRGERVHDSSQIVRYLSDRFGDERTSLYPPEHREAIEQLERWLSDHLGPHTRRIAYFYLLGDRRWFSELGHRNVGRAQAMANDLCAPLLRRMLVRALGVDPRRTEASRSKLREAIARLDAQLGDRPYLVGDRFSAADLTAACLLAPVLAVTRDEGYSAFLVPSHGLPPDAAALVEEVRASRIGRHALRMFAQER